MIEPVPPKQLVVTTCGFISGRPTVYGSCQTPAYGRSNAMLPRLLLALISCGVLAPAANAGPLRMACDVTDNQTGKMMHRVLSIDASSGIVRDNAMAFREGAISPFADNLEEFVQVENGRATWGNRRKDSKAGAGVFTLDLATGEYAFDSWFRGRLSHGRCRPDDGTI